MTTSASIQLLQEQTYDITLTDGTQHIGVVFSGLSFDSARGAVAEFHYYDDETEEGGELEIPLSAIASIK